VQCADLTVPEDPEHPAGRSIALHVTVVRAFIGPAPADPLVVLPELPDLAASATFVPQGAFARVNLDRDVVLVDQRGTGASHALRCSTDSPEDVLAGPQRVALLRACPGQLDADLRLYTTPVAVADLEEVRRQLGYGDLDLYGQGYGGRVALGYERAYPQHVRSLILDGAEPADAAAAEANRAQLTRQTLEATLVACAQSPGCAERFPNLSARTADLIARLDARPVTVQSLHPTTAAPVSLVLTGARLVEATFFLSATTSSAALIPWLLDRASAADDLVPLAATLERLADQRQRLLNAGATYAIRCSEDVPLAGTAAGTDETAICGGWPTRPAPPAALAPFHADVPALILAAERDPSSYPVTAQRLAESLSRSRLVMLPGGRHGVIGDECVARLAAAFVQLGAADTLDTGCLDAERPIPFFLSPNGPEG